jgi:uncharacterized protein (TIGR01777 family)
VRVVVAGSSGFIGTALVATLRADGHDVVRLVRRTPARPDELSWSPHDGTIDPAALAGADAAINMAGVGVGDHRWTDAYKREIQRSRVDATTTLSHAIATAGAGGPRVLLNASASGYYGDRGDEPLDERSPAGDGFLADVCRSWETATQAAEDAGIRVCHMRSGLVLGPGGGPLKRMAPLFRAGVGGKLGSGRQFMPWISLTDEVGAIRFLLDHDISGPVNLSGPTPVRNSEFTRAFGQVVDRPAVLPAPTFGLRIVLGEFASDVLTSARMLPSVLLQAGFQHEHSDVTSALRWSLSR